jgi:hypothetical protein
MPFLAVIPVTLVAIFGRWIMRRLGQKAPWPKSTRQGRAVARPLTGQVIRKPSDASRDASIRTHARLRRRAYRNHNTLKTRLFVMTITSASAPALIVQLMLGNTTSDCKMSTKPQIRITRTGEALPVSEHLEVAQYLSVRTCKSKIQDVTAALISSGYTSLDQQAKALGLPRATAWTIITNKHKLGRLSKKTIDRILTNHETPRAVRAVVQRYLAERPINGSRKSSTKTNAIP